MKKIEKLRLNKEIVASLNNIEMEGAKGGAPFTGYETTLVNCFTKTPACGSCSDNMGGGGAYTYNCPQVTNTCTQGECKEVVNTIKRNGYSKDCGGPYTANCDFDYDTKL